VTSARDWVSGMLEHISEGLQTEGYRLTGAILPPVLWDSLAHAARTYVGPTVPTAAHITMVVGGHEVLLTRGIAQAIDLRAVPL
jgi:hypothetical protein